MLIDMSKLIDDGDEIRALNDPILAAQKTLTWIADINTFIDSISNNGLQYEARRLLGDQIDLPQAIVGDRLRVTKIIQGLKHLKILAEESRLIEVISLSGKIPSTRSFPTTGNHLSTTFEEYTLEKQIGSGGTGIVFRATSSEGTQCAIKILQDGSSSKKAKRFKNEISFCQMSHHVGIVKVLDHGAVVLSDKKYLFYVMPLYPSTFRNQMKKLTAGQNLKVIGQLLDALESAHLRGCFHRDIKPENILTDEHCENIIITDFGIAHFEEPYLLSAIETLPADRLANFRYAAPEQRQKGATVDHRADIYALGLVFNEMFTGHVPQGTGFKTISEIYPDLEYIDQIVGKMIHQNPENRFQKISEVKYAFQKNRE